MFILPARVCLSGLVAERIDGWSLIRPSIIDPIFHRVRRDRYLLKRIRIQSVQILYQAIVSAGKRLFRSVLRKRVVLEVLRII